MGSAVRHSDGCNKLVQVVLRVEMRWYGNLVGRSGVWGRGIIRGSDWRCQRV